MEDNMLTEKNTTGEVKLQSQKINLKKKIHIPWIVITLILIVTTVFSIFDYKHYKEGQEFAVAYQLTLFESLDMSGEFEKYKDNYEELVNAMYRKYHPTYSSYFLELHGISKKDVVDTANDADYAFGEIMTKAGYECYKGSYYLKHTDIFGYTIDYNTLALILYIICASLILLQIVFIIWYVNNRKHSIVVNSSRVTCMFGKKTKKEFLIKDISAVESLSKKGLRIKGNGINYKINRLTNADELKSYLMNMIEKNKIENPIASSNDNHLSNADELKK